MFLLPAVDGDEEEEDGEGVVEEAQDVDAVEPFREDEEREDVRWCLFTTIDIEAKTDGQGSRFNQ